MSTNDSATSTITSEELANMNADDFLKTIATVPYDTIADAYTLLVDPNSTTSQTPKVRALSRLIDTHGGYVTQNTASKDREQFKAVARELLLQKYPE